MNMSALMHLGDVAPSHILRAGPAMVKYSCWPSGHGLLSVPYSLVGEVVPVRQCSAHKWTVINSGWILLRELGVVGRRGGSVGEGTRCQAW